MWVRACLCVCVFVCVYVCDVCMCVCVCVCQDGAPYPFICARRWKNTQTSTRGLGSKSGADSSSVSARSKRCVTARLSLPFQ